jgi:hypothetical protein
MMQEIPCGNCEYASADELVAVALYRASEMEEVTSNLSSNSPPAFIWNVHRDSIPMPGNTDNSYSYDVSDMPSPDFLRQQGITKILYIYESTTTTSIHPWSVNGGSSDSDLILQNYQTSGIEVYSQGISKSPENPINSNPLYYQPKP